MFGFILRIFVLTAYTTLWTLPICPQVHAVSKTIEDLRRIAFDFDYISDASQVSVRKSAVTKDYKKLGFIVSSVNLLVYISFNSLFIFCYMWVLHGNIDQKLVNSLPRLLNCEIGGLDCYYNRV